MTNVEIAIVVGVCTSLLVHVLELSLAYVLFKKNDEVHESLELFSEWGVKVTKRVCEHSNAIKSLSAIHDADTTCFECIHESLHDIEERVSAIESIPVVISLEEECECESCKKEEPAPKKGKKNGKA